MESGLVVVMERLLQAQNAHDLEAFLACFAPDYQSEQPVHPDRAFQGVEQVRKNWSALFQEITDFKSELLRSAVEGNTTWTEWHWSGTRRDGTRFDMRGMVISGIESGQIKWQRLYMEPVQEVGVGIDATVTSLTHGSPQER